MKLIGRSLRRVRYYKTYLSIILHWLRGTDMYKFKTKDMLLYFAEGHVIRKKAKLENEGEVFLKIRIEDTEIYWPKKYSSQDLPWLWNEIYSDFKWNPSSYSHPRILDQNFEWVVDAGCCEGYFSRYIREHCPMCVVHAFEPLVDMKDALLATFLDDRNSGLFRLNQVAIGEQSGYIRFGVDGDHLCNSSGCAGDGGEMIEQVSLDEYFDGKDAIGRGLIKMDIEGAEMMALKGATKILANSRPTLAVAVYHGYENAEMCKRIILDANPSYQIEFRGMYCYEMPPRPYMLFAF